MSQFEQENDLGRGGGEVDEQTLEEGWENRAAVLGRDDPAQGSDELDDEVERGR